MRPLKLQFKGINSFSEHTIIDFDSLTKNGLFGIFGDTGSGKSTILDCISFALYGSVERSKEKTDIINYRCTSAEVEFSFDIINGGKRKIYTARRTIKNDKSGTHKATLYEKDGETEVCIADKASAVERKIVEILGVEEDDFRKCIALPQGEFSQFVKSAPRDRLALIERLFSLSKYGDRLKEKISARQNDIFSEYNTIYGKLSAYEDVSEEDLKTCKTRLKDGRKQLENLSAELKAASKKCEEFKELNKTRLELEEKREQIKNLDGEIGSIEKKISAENDSVTALEKELARSAFDEKIDECVKLSASFQTAEGKPERLKKLLISLENKRAEYRRKEEELKAILSRRATAEAGVEKAENDLKSFSAADLEKIFGVQFKGAVLRDEYVKNLDYFADFYGGLRTFEDDSALYAYASGETKKKIDEYKQRVLDIKDLPLESVNEQIKKLQKREDEKQLLQKVLTDRREELSRLLSAVEIKQSELKAVQKEGAELRARADELEEELKKVFGENCRDFEAAVRENELALRELRRQKQALTERLDTSKNARNELNISIEKFKSLRGKTVDEAAALMEKLNALAAFADAEKSLPEAAEENRQRLENEVNALTGEIAVLAANCENAERRLKEKDEISKDFSLIKKESDLIAQLKEATKNNRFLEFIAGEYLHDISSAASSTLLKLTDGRYFLTYKDNNFFVGDNFDCGNLRGVNTLSGGETFLVSLSLALSLSQTICARSNKSIEFFFLDEGFGTLDSTLVDTVMSALEKLKSSHFTIGVISHVEELKHRIDCKITVKKATESTGSTVQLSC